MRTAVWSSRLQSGSPASFLWLLGQWPPEQQDVRFWKSEWNLRDKPTPFCAQPTGHPAPISQLSPAQISITWLRCKHMALEADRQPGLSTKDRIGNLSSFAMLVPPREVLYSFCLAAWCLVSYQEIHFPWLIWNTSKNSLSDGEWSKGHKLYQGTPGLRKRGTLWLN